MSKREKDTGNDKSMIDWSEDKNLFTKSNLLKWLKKPIFKFRAFVYALCFILFLMGIMFVVTLSYHAVNSAFSIGQFSMESWDDFKSLALIVGGVAAFIAAIIRLSIVHRQTKASEEKTEIDRQSHYTTLYIKSIELLGATRLVKKKDDDGKVYDDTEAAMELRLGAIYALERIARDSWKDHWPIMEVLTAYIRENSPYKEGDEPKEIRTDIQAILDVISRRNKEWITNEKMNDYYLNLSHCNLSLSIIIGGDLSDTILIGSSLFGSSFINLDFSSVDFGSVNMEQVNFGKCNLKETNFRNTTKLSNIFFTRCNLSKAYIITLNSTKNLFISDSISLGLTLKSHKKQEINFENSIYYIDDRIDSLQKNRRHGYDNGLFSDKEVDSLFKKITTTKSNLIWDDLILQTSSTKKPKANSNPRL